MPPNRFRWSDQAEQAEHLEHVDAASHTGDQPRRVVLVIQRIRVCTQIDQQPRDREPVLRDREQEWVRRLSSRVSRLAPARIASAAAVASPRSAAASKRRLATSLDGLSASSASRSTCDLVMAPGRGVLERGDLITLGLQPQVGAGCDQDLYGVDVPARSVAQDDRLVQAVQPRLLMWSISILASTSRPAMSAWPRSAARISPVPLKESLESTSAPCSSVRFSSSRYPSLVEMR